MCLLGREQTKLWENQFSGKLHEGGVLVGRGCGSAKSSPSTIERRCMVEQVVTLWLQGKSKSMQGFQQGSLSITSVSPCSHGLLPAAAASDLGLQGSLQGKETKPGIHRTLSCHHLSHPCDFPSLSPLLKYLSTCLPLLNVLVSVSLNYK